MQQQPEGSKSLEQLQHMRIDINWIHLWISRSHLQTKHFENPDTGAEPVQYSAHLRTPEFHLKLISLKVKAGSEAVVHV